MTPLTISSAADDDNNDKYVVIEKLGEDFIKARSPEGKFVLLRVSISPSLRVPWYKNYIQYRSEISRRMKDWGVYTFCELWIKQIGGEQVARKSPYNLMEPVFPRNSRMDVFEFFEPNTDMRKELDKGHEISFADRVFMAQLMMNSISALHEARIVHTDLKPDNILLIPNEDERTKQFAKYHAKLIDVGFALLVDKKAPWGGHAGYTGTPGYFSPEHLTSIPETASDVFTCGLILCELLCDKHPLLDLADDQEAYLGKISAREISCPPLLDKMEDLEGEASSAAVVDVINCCLHPDPKKRPAARDVIKVLTCMQQEWP